MKTLASEGRSVLIAYFDAPDGLGQQSPESTTIFRRPYRFEKKGTSNVNLFEDCKAC